MFVGKDEMGDPGLLAQGTTQRVGRRPWLVLCPRQSAWAGEAGGLLSPPSVILSKSACYPPHTEAAD